ncbi:cytosine-specific methyltransferase [Prolixibacter bellariivorans]|uniref:Cytosine-specific methyltransferase n=1 Tax=Prolixibacter bellariivorans TaxID=314319 RepID=A0A5M4B1T5_9BACT|nr:DNA (cytosine-5-)-methyltransferase [Prolixibacter bellariivorans]GET33846.1 cytosine-specific methyltransferase [Prolixibacter bellariivorans]
MKSFELFSGAGGLAEGLKISGFNHIALLEYNKDACNTLKVNFPESKVFEQDVREFNFSEIGKVDLIGGGPPCQPFSLGGKAKGNNDHRDMFPFAIKGIKELTPKAFIFENVKGLLRQSFSSYFNYIILQLTYPEINIEKKESWESHLTRLEKVHTAGLYSGLKYNIVFRLVNAANYGVPQKRERVIIVGIRDDLGIDWSFPKETHSEERLLWDKFVTGEYWDRNKIENRFKEIPDLKLKKQINKLRYQYGFFSPDTKPWVTIREALSGLPDPRESNFHSEHIFRDGARIYPGHTGSYIDEPSKTIKAGDHGVPGGENMIRFETGKVRYLTILEAKRIQTFPDNYEITGSWTEGMRQLGNAVPVRLANIIGNELKKKLSC